MSKWSKASYGISILIISIENDKIKTEEIYFINEMHKECLSFKRDKALKKKLHISNMFFFSTNINFTKAKVRKEIGRFDITIPQISKIFFICDNDQSYKPEQIKRATKRMEEIIKDKLKTRSKSEYFYLKYERGLKFEDFLKLHFKDKRLLNKFNDGFKKTDKDIYKKTMGPNGKNFDILIENIETESKFLEFKKHLFTEH